MSAFDSFDDIYENTNRLSRNISEQVFIRSQNDIENEKDRVNSNRFLSANYIKKRYNRDTRSKIDLNNKENEVKDTYYDDEERQFTFCYLCSLGLHVHEKTKPVPVSKRRYLKKYVDLSAWLKKVGYDESLYDLEYKFKIKTGSNKYAGTNANVWFSIDGTKGDWPKTEIKRIKSINVLKFPSDSEIKFYLNGPYIGNLKCLKIGHDADSAKDGWFLDYVEISCEELRKKWIFQCNRWISKHRPPDYERVVHLYPGDKPVKGPVLSDILGTEYLIIIKTDNKMLAGTDANVTFQMAGRNGTSEVLALETKHVNLFEKNQSDIFMFETPHDLGEPGKIKISHDSKNFASDWRIKEVKIIYSKNPNNYYIFPFKRWLDDKNKFSSVIECDNTQQITARDPQKSGKVIYFLTVFTGKARNAGTDANVFVEIVGSRGRTSVQRLTNNKKNKFERGEIDNFTFIDNDVGDIRNLIIRHDNTGTAPGFFLERVLLKCQKTVLTNTNDTQSEDLLEKINEIKLIIKYKTPSIKNAILAATTTKRFYSSTRRAQSLTRKKPLIKEKRSKSADSKNRKPLAEKLNATKSLTSILKSPRSPRNLNKSVQFKKSIEYNLNKLENNDKKSLIVSNMKWLMSMIYDDKKLKGIKRLDKCEKKYEEIDEAQFKKFKIEYQKLLKSNTTKHDADQLNDENDLRGSRDKLNTDDSIYVFECNQWLAKDEGDRKIERILKINQIIKQNQNYQK